MLRDNAQNRNDLFTLTAEIRKTAEAVMSGDLAS